MLTTRQQNATAEANPSVTKFTKEQNDFKMKECQQYAAKKPLDWYHLNLYVLDLNYNSTITKFNKAYRSMARRFHPDNNYGVDTNAMMTMINTAKDGLLDLLCDNDQVREEEMSEQQKMRNQFHLITILIQNQLVHHPNQHHHILDHGHPKQKL